MKESEETFVRMKKSLLNSDTNRPDDYLRSYVELEVETDCLFEPSGSSDLAPTYLSLVVIRLEPSMVCRHDAYCIFQYSSSTLYTSTTL